MKKAMSILLSLVMILTALPLTAVSSFAASYTVYTSGDWSYRILNDGTAEICKGESTAYSGNETDVVIPSQIDGYTVTSIGYYAFYECISPESITIPDSVTRISYYAFYSCTSLKSITIPESVTSIGNSAFEGCISLESIAIPESVTSIGNSVFFNCTALESIYVNEENENYCSEDGVLFNNDKTNLICYPAGKTDNAYIIPDSITYIDGLAFHNCTSLTSITIPESVVIIEEGAVGYYFDDYTYEKIEGFTIYGYADTEAERYANKNGFNFISLGGTQQANLMGDVNSDGKITVVDARLTLKCIAGLIYLTDAEFNATDMNCDGKASIIDAKWMLQAVAGLRTLDEGYTTYAPVQAVPDSSKLVKATNEKAYISVNNLKPKAGEIITVSMNIEQLSSFYGKITYSEAFEFVKADISNHFTAALNISENGVVKCAGTTVNSDFIDTIATIELRYLGGNGVIALTEMDAVNDDDSSVALEGNEITIEEAICTHENTELRNEKSASCKETGYTGDLYCTDCNALIEKGELISATGHQNTELRNEKPASCNQAGYTGDLFCTDCGVFVSKGEVIPITSHNYGEWITLVAPTCKNKGAEIRICSLCSGNEMREIDIAEHTVVTDKAVKESCTSDGKTEGSHCSVCGEIIVAQETIPATGHQHTELRNEKSASCKETGYTGDLYCKDCGTMITKGEKTEKLPTP